MDTEHDINILDIEQNERICKWISTNNVFVAIYKKKRCAKMTKEAKSQRSLYHNLEKWWDDLQFSGKCFDILLYLKQEITQLFKH